MLIKHIAIVSETPRVDLSTVAVISAAIQKQVMRDFAPIWNEQATVAAFNSLDDVPSDYWPVIIRDDIKTDAAGIHWFTKTGQPFALVDSDFDISVTCSHEVLEMLADPYGKRLIAGPSVVPEQGRVNYLAEVCDPSEAFTYEVNGISVSDFYTREFFSPVKSPGARYSFMGVITEPREILPGGYISWMLPKTGEWYQQTYFNNKKDIRYLGVLNLEEGQNWRGAIDEKTSSRSDRTNLTGNVEQKKSAMSSLTDTGLRKYVDQLVQKKKQPK